MTGELWTIIEMVLWFAVILFPAVFIICEIVRKMSSATLGKKILSTILASVLISLAFYPFMAALMEYTVFVETGINTNLTLFHSDVATYVIILLGIIAIYAFFFSKREVGDDD